MKIHTVELWPGAPELHEVVLHSEHIQALARVEAERDAMESMVAMLEDKEWAEHASKGPVSSRLETCITTLMNELSEANERADEATVSSMTYAEKHDTAQAQLAEAVRLLRKIERRMYGEDVEHRFTDLLPDLDRITAQAEQQEAGHGHVTPRADGVVMKCGGPGLCAGCTAEKEAQSEQAGDDARKAAFENHWYAQKATAFSSTEAQRHFDAGWKARADLATQPAAGEPEQQTAINADDLPTKKYPLGAFDFDAPVAGGEPVAWQMIHRHHPNPSWQNCPKELFDQYEAYHKQYGGESPVRALVVAAPPAAVHGDEAVPADLKARCREIAQWRKSGVLRGDALRKYAESRWPGDPFSLQMAEHETATEAFQVVSAMRAQAGEDSSHA